VTVKLSETKAFVIELRTAQALNKGSCSIGLTSYVIDVRGRNSVSPPIEVVDTHSGAASCAQGNTGGHLTTASVDFTKGEKVLKSDKHGVAINIDAVKSDGSYAISLTWKNPTQVSKPVVPPVANNDEEDDDED
jgi:hypothetical protein